MVRNFAIWCLALVVLLLFFWWGRLSPVASLLVISLSPLPVYLVGRRLGNLAALFLVLAVSLLIFSLKPGLAMVVDYLGFGELLLMGFMLSSLESRGWTPDRAIILTVLGLTFISLLFLAGQGIISGLTPDEIFSRKAGEIMEMLSGVLSGAGETPSELKVLGISLEEIRTLIQSLLPSLVVTNTGLMAWINVVLARQLMSLLGWVKPEPPLYYWSTPEWFIFPVLAAGFLLLVPVPLLRLVSMNLLVILGLLYFCQGVAVVAAWFQRFRLPLFLRCIGYPLMFLHPLFLLVITLGLMDIWLDFRRLHQPLDA
ncbi:MAG: hypothetical protein A2Z73_03355 [Deltaproteobacteria bacterium RBG_13_60_28]|nr:MAG: hypothetical protein A2Z73_03355 [Deltaproteobacteria bacterium RBG_13_60_28]